MRPSAMTNATLPATLTMLRKKTDDTARVKPGIVSKAARTYRQSEIYLRLLTILTRTVAGYRKIKKWRVMVFRNACLRVSPVSASPPSPLSNPF